MKMTPFVSACLLASGLAVAVVPTLVAAQMPAPKVKAGYRVPRLSDGKPDLQGVWSNATLTRLERTASFGDRLIMTPEELAKTEGDTQARNQRQNARTDQATIENWTTAAVGRDTEDLCRSGSTGPGCGYNAGWTDPGDLVMRVNGEPRTSLITFPANGRMPARVAAAGGGRGGAAGRGGAGAGRGAGRGGAPGAAPQGVPGRDFIVESSEEGPAQTFQGQNDNPEGRSLGERCIMSFGISSGPVMTPQLYNNTYKIVQTKDHVAIWVEMVHDVRIVRLNSQHRNDGVRPYMGDSIGRWDGDTLVVETVGYHPRQSARGISANGKVTERFTRVAPDRLHYAFMVEDPTVWVEPWGGEYEFAAAPGIYEYACHEGNYGLENILAGARFEEQQAAAARGGGAR